jgi:hypothetical protein
VRISLSVWNLVLSADLALLAVIYVAQRLARVCIEDAMNYAHKRKVFNKRLIDSEVIRSKVSCAEPSEGIRKTAEPSPRKVCLVTELSLICFLRCSSPT